MTFTEEVLAHVTEHLDEAQLPEPVEVVHHHGTGRAVIEVQNAREDRLLRLDVRLHALHRLELTFLVLSGWVADEPGARRP